MFATISARVNSRWLLLFVILVAGTALRHQYNSVTFIDQPIRGDARFYLVYANNLIDHATFSKDYKNDPPLPDAYWAPGYPVFLASLIKISDWAGVKAYDLILSSQLGLGFLIILFTYLTATTFLPRYWPLLPTALVALSPHMISTAQYILTETLSAFLLITSLFLFIRGFDRKNNLTLGSAGLFLAALYLVNPVTLFVAPLIAAVATLMTRQHTSGEEWLKPATLVLVLLPLVMVVGIWSARTAVNVPEDSPTSSTRLLTNLVQGMHHDYHDIWRANTRDPNNPATVDLAAIDGSFSEFFHLLTNNFSEDPAGMMKWYILDKPILLWGWDLRVGAGDIYTYPVFYSLYHTSKVALASYSIMRSMHFWLFGCAALGIVFLFTNRNERSWIPATLYTTVIYVSAVYTVAQAEPRYSIPLRPEMYLLATFFIWQSWALYQKNKKRPA